MRSILVRLPHLWLLLGLAALLFTIGIDFRPVAGNILFDLANVNAVKTLLGRNDKSLPVAAQEYELANRLSPESASTNTAVLAALRATASCQALRSEDFSDHKAQLAFQGRCLWLAEDRVQAVQVWRQADMGPSLIHLADYDKANGQMLWALDEYLQALAVALTLKAQLGLGDLYERMEQWQDAEQTYEQAILIAPDSALAHQALAFFRLHRGLGGERTEQELLLAIRLALAEPQVEYGVSLPWLYTNLALIYLQTGRSELAEDVARRATVLDSRIAAAHHYLGEALRLQGNPHSAILELKQALELGSQSVWVRYSLTLAYLDAGDLANARLTAQQLAESAPQFEGLPTLYRKIR